MCVSYTMKSLSKMCPFTSMGAKISKSVKNQEEIVCKRKTEMDGAAGDGHHD